MEKNIQKKISGFFFGFFYMDIAVNLKLFRKFVNPHRDKNLDGSFNKPILYQCVHTIKRFYLNLLIGPDGNGADSPFSPGGPGGPGSPLSPSPVPLN